MSIRWGIRIVSLAVALVCAASAPSNAMVIEGMCNAGTMCGTCCYGSDYGSIASCCKDNGCTSYCELETSFCCPGGYQITNCAET